MIKDKNYIFAENFQITHYPKSSGHWGEIIINFCFHDKKYSHVVRMSLSKVEWSHLLTFLLKTKDKKFIPKNFDAYNGFIVDKNQYKYFSVKFDKKITDLFFNGPQDQKSKEWVVARKRKEYRDIKHRFFTRSMNLIHGKVEILISRERFLEFRRFALKANQHFKLKVKNKSE